MNFNYRNCLFLKMNQKDSIVMKLLNKIKLREEKKTKFLLIYHYTLD